MSDDDKLRRAIRAEIEAERRALYSKWRYQAMLGGWMGSGAVLFVWGIITLALMGRIPYHPMNRIAPALVIAGALMLLAGLAYLWRRRSM